MFNESSLLEFGSYLECSTLQVETFHHSSWSLLPSSKWRDHTFTIISFSFLSSFYFPFLYVLVFIFFYLVSIFFLSLIYSLIPHLFIINTYDRVFSLPSRTEPSHLLNHLVKFISSGNLLWVSHHICVKSKP